MRMGDEVAACQHRLEGFRLAEVGMRPVKHQPLVETRHFGDVLVDDPDFGGHKYNRNPLLLVQFVEHLIEKPLGGGVDTGSGLVQEEQFRGVHDRPGNENPLLLPAGQAACWRTKPILDQAANSSTGFPIRSTLPLAGRKSPRMSLTRVVFPEPLGPSMATKSPWETEKFTSSSTGIEPYWNESPSTRMSSLSLFTGKPSPEVSQILFHDIKK